MPVGNVELVKLNEDNPKITFADIGLDGHIFRTYEKSTGIFSADTVIEIQNTSNGKESIYTIEEVAKAVDSCNNVIAINFGDEVFNLTIFNLLEYTEPLAENKPFKKLHLSE